MDHFDSAVTDPRICKTELERSGLKQPRPGSLQGISRQLYLGSNGDIGIFIYDQAAVNVMNSKMVDPSAGSRKLSGGQNPVRLLHEHGCRANAEGHFETVVLSLLDSSEERSAG